MSNKSQSKDVNVKGAKRTTRFGAIGIILLMLTIMFSMGAASAAVTTYYVETSNTGAIGSSGYTSDLNDCSGGNQDPGKVTTLSNSGYDCTSTGGTRIQEPSGALGDQFIAIFPTAYATEYAVTGQSGASFQLRDVDGRGPITYRFELGYASGGTFTSFGSPVTQVIDDADNTLFTNIDLSGISGNAPAGTYLALKVSISSWPEARDGAQIYLGDNYNSGEFSADEVSVASTYNVTVIPSPTSAGVIAGGSYLYTITVNNNGNTDGNYTLGVADSNTADFQTSTLGTSSLAVASGGSAQTILTVTANGGAPISASDITTVTATSVEDGTYSGSGQVTTTVQGPLPSVSVTLTPSAQNVQPSNQVTYTVTVDNTGNVADTYTLSLDNVNTADFTYGLLSTTTGSLAPGGQYITTMTVDATAGATPTNNHGQTVTATGTASDTSAGVTTTVQALGPSKIIVSANRGVIIDDPNDGGTFPSDSGLPDYDGGSSGWNSNYWNGEGTTIRAYALVLDPNGNPLNGESVSFSIAGIGASNISVNTGTDGIASFSYQMNDAANNGAKAAGNYTITATSGSASASTQFVYTYFGCTRCHGNKGTNGAGSARSPYSQVYVQLHENTGNHKDSATAVLGTRRQCLVCHTLYGPTAYTVQDTQTPWGIHEGKRYCQDCHDSSPSNGLVSQDPQIFECNSPGCHPQQSDKVSFVGFDFYPATKYVYSSNPMKAHDQNNNVSCLFCHGPAHNFTKPDASAGTSNNYTEDSQCASCHVSKGKHSGNNPVYCTACHSQDAHVIGVINKTSGIQPAFVDVGSANAMTASDCVECHQSGPEATYFAGLTGMAGYGYGTDFVAATPVHNNHNNTVACTVCHNNSDFHNIKFLQPSGAYAASKATAVECVDCHDGTNTAVRNVVNTKFGSLPPTVNANMNHSSDNSGQKWGNYWTTPNEACLYCHGTTMHNASALGVAGGALGSDNVGDPIATGTVCSSCHNQSDSDYAVTTLLTPAPPANKPGANFNVSGFDHTGYFADSDCKMCHGGNLVGGETMSEFTHNVAPAGGGACDSCHKQPPNGASRYNTLGAHNTHNSSVFKANYGALGNNVGCDYCHSTGGANEASHPNAFDDAAVVTNVSASITNYTQNITAGSDDTCSGVSCHANGAVSAGANIGTATWDTATAGACDNCHSTASTGMPPTGNHLTHYTNNSYTCAECHGTNADAGTQTGHKTNATIDISFTNVSGSINASKGCDVYCHSPNPNDAQPNPTWDVSTVTCGDCHTIPPTAFTTRNSVSHPASSGSDCDNCHGTDAVTGNHIGHLNGGIDTDAMSCESCHAQPPAGTSQPNMTGAHDTHNSSLFQTSYGALSNNTGCNYCHNSGGDNEGSHPQNDGSADIVTNASATIITYAQNLTSGSDDTCSGVNCHANSAISTAANIGTATWDTATAGACDNCHSTASTGMPPTGNHLTHYTNNSYTCAECHGTNADAGTQTGHKTNATIDISFTNVSGSINASKGCDVYCHSPNPNDAQPNPTWGVSTVGCGDCHSIPPVTTRTGATPHTGITECDACHGVGADTATHAGHANGTVGVASSCVVCHADKATSANLGLHSSFNGTSAVDNGDCETCHNKSGNLVIMISGGANAANTYYCADCHTSGGAGPNPSSIIFTDKQHGEAACVDCHVADGTYHQSNPRGAVANSTYVNRYGPGNATVVDCSDCHYASNLDDAPFNAPGAGSHTATACANGGCHAGGATMVETVHSVSPYSYGYKPTITVPSLSASTITQGTASVSVIATVSVFESSRETADGAQYRVMDGVIEVLPWTAMIASDGDFEGSSDTATATISTAALSAGTYTVEVRGMAGGPSPNTTIRYYPMNGDVSATQTTSLTVEPPKGYINGTVTSGGPGLAGAIVSTTGASTTTASDGTYSLSVVAGTYNVTASKAPAYADSTATGVVVVSSATTTQDFVLSLNPTGSITGTVTNSTA